MAWTPSDQRTKNFTDTVKQKAFAKLLVVDCILDLCRATRKGLVPQPQRDRKLPIPKHD